MCLQIVQICIVKYPLPYILYLQSFDFKKVIHLSVKHFEVATSKVNAIEAVEMKIKPLKITPFIYITLKAQCYIVGYSFAGNVIHELLILR